NTHATLRSLYPGESESHPVSHTRNAFRPNLVSRNMTRTSQKLVLTEKGPKAFLRRHATKRRALIALSLSFAFLFLCGVTGAAGRMADKMILYMHVARLYAKSPDSKLSMP